MRNGLVGGETHSTHVCVLRGLAGSEMRLWGQPGVLRLHCSKPCCAVSCALMQCCTCACALGRWFHLLPTHSMHGLGPAVPHNQYNALPPGNRTPHRASPRLRARPPSHHARTPGHTDARQLLDAAQQAVAHPGSCTACVGLLGGDGVLTLANLGDSGARVVRGGGLLLATSPQQHQFNMPYQMASPLNFPDTDTAADAQLYQVRLVGSGGGGSIRGPGAGGGGVGEHVWGMLCVGVVGGGGGNCLIPALRALLLLCSPA